MSQNPFLYLSTNSTVSGFPLCTPIFMKKGYRGRQGAKLLNFSPSMPPSFLSFSFYLFVLALKKTLDSIKIPLNLVYSVSRYIIKYFYLEEEICRNTPLLSVDNAFIFKNFFCGLEGDSNLCMMNNPPIFKLNSRLHLDITSFVINALFLFKN